MDPQLAIIIAQLLLRYGPGVAEAFVTIFHKQEVTLEDWTALLAKVKTYDQYVSPTP